MSVHVAIDGALSGQAAADAALVLQAIRAGHLYTAVDGLATPPAFEFLAANSRDTVTQGDELEAGGGVGLHVRSNAPPHYTTIVHRGTAVLATARDAGDWTIHATEEPAVYWVEIVAPHQPQPIAWLRSNPIYVRGTAKPVETTTVAARPPGLVEPLFDGASTNGWQVEHDPASLAAIDFVNGTSGGELRFRYGLGGGTPTTQTAALVYTTTNGIQAADRLTFRIRAERPMRISVQLRAKNADRWQRSVYVDPSATERTVRFDDMTPVGITSTGPTVAPPLADILGVMFVVDLANNKPGSSGRVWLSDVRFER